MRSGLFDHWQGEYASRGVVTFPVTRDKTPAVRGYLNVGSKASAQFALKFPDALGIGFACKKNRITVLDVDTKDERVLADGLSRYGHTPIIVRTGSGHYQAWYRHNGEARRIRPKPRVPIDILGDGFVVAPPTQANTGEYRIIHGSLDDLDRLPKMRSLSQKEQPDHARADASAMRPHSERIHTNLGLKEGDGRNPELWRQCMKMARGCQRIEELMGKAMEHNREAFYDPLSAEEVLKVVVSAWGYEVEGKNWFGHGARVVISHAVVEDLAADDPDAFALLSICQRHHWGREFHLANAFAESLKWDLRRFKRARLNLLSRGLIECIHAGGRGPHVGGLQQPREANTGRRYRTRFQYGNQVQPQPDSPRIESNPMGQTRFAQPPLTCERITGIDRRTVRPRDLR